MISFFGGPGFGALSVRLNAQLRSNAAVNCWQMQWENGARKNRKYWEYIRLSEAGKKVLTRCPAATDGYQLAASHVIRLAMIYALLDGTKVIKDVHLKAALEVWRYCEDFVRYIFGANLGDDTADTILLALRRSGVGLTRTEISKVCSHNKSGSEITRALSVLEREGLAGCEKTTGRHSKEIWHATG